MRWILPILLSLSACQLSAPSSAAPSGTGAAASATPSTGATASPQPSASASATPAAVTSSVTLGGHTWEAEIEDTDAGRQQGLSDRASLDANAAMVFAWGSPEVVAFWMHGMEFPLDIVFVRSGKVVSITRNAAPCPSSGVCPTFGPTTPVDFVIEVNAGQTSQFGLKEGDAAAFTP